MDGTQMVTIITIDGPRHVPAVARTAHFAVTPDQGEAGSLGRRGEGWMITHLASGRALGPVTYADPADALRVAEALEREPFRWSVAAPSRPTLRRMADAVARVESTLGGGVIVARAT